MIALDEPIRNGLSNQTHIQSRHFDVAVGGDFSVEISGSPEAMAWVEAAVENGELVVRRILTEVGCTIDETESVVKIGRHAKAIRDWELTPVVLTRKH